MARKKQEAALMRELESQEEWEETLAKEGLWVIDVYQEWAGPCDAMVSNFRRIKNELGDDLLHFAVAKADNIDALDKYRGSCEPCFLFYAGGLLVAFVHGANSPLILRTLTEQLAYEHKVIDGSAERKEVKDPFVTARVQEAPAEEEEEEGEEDGTYVPHRRVSALPGEYEEVEAGYTVAIIKPNAVAEGKVDEIIAELKAKGIQIVAQDERQLTEEEAREFYSHAANEDYYDNLCKFMSSGPSHVLLLTKGQTDDSVIKDWRDMLGPPVVEEAKEHAPDSLRARYGEAGLFNALHGSDSTDTAARELAFFFPEQLVPTVLRKSKDIQRTLALIRPAAFAQEKDAILERIKEAGFTIALHKEVQLTREQAEDFYSEHVGQPYFDELVSRMCSGPLLALGLARDDAVTSWRNMLGPPDVEEAKQTAPDSLRAQFASEDSPINPLHGSDTPETAKKELEFFFPMQQTVALIKPDAYGTKEAIIDKIHEAGFRIAARKETTITREIAESFYADQKDQAYFEDLVNHMISGKTMFMVLSREDAVQGWRQVIGPLDPNQAKEEAPDSLRATFGTDMLHNAVHGCSTVEQAHERIKMIFGPLEFNPDGTVVKVEEPEQEAEEQAEQQQQQNQQEGQQEQQDEAAGEDEQRPKSGEGQQEEGGGQEQPPAPADEQKEEDPLSTTAEQQEEQAAEQADADATQQEEQAPEQAPAEQAPTEEAPTEQAPAEETPAELASTEEAPAEQAPTEEAPTEQASTEEAPAEQAPSEEAPAEQASAEEAPAGQASAEEAPAEQASAEAGETKDATKDGDTPQDGDTTEEGDAGKE